MDKEEYLEKLLKEIEAKKNAGKNGVYKIKEKISDNTAKYVEKYLSENTNHRIRFERCPSCTKTWDIIIMFTKR